MSIAKIAADVRAWSRPTRSFASARHAFRAFLSELDWSNGEAILLPSYVGWSPREGSGVFDPVREQRVPYAFYRLDRRLHIDLDSFEEQLRQQRIGVAVIVHYFGYVDPSYREAVRLARTYGARVVEDEAHAWLSDQVGGACGREGDACFAALHKLLPLKQGGLLIGSDSTCEVIERLPGDPDLLASVANFDLWAIAQRRRENAAFLAERLGALHDYLEPLWGPPTAGVVPQTFPVLVHHVSRDRLYELMNESGYGVVSLYHTLVREIRPTEFPDSHRIARSILNLPVHQDCTPSDLELMLQCLAETVIELEEQKCHALCHR